MDSDSIENPRAIAVERWHPAEAAAFLIGHAGLNARRPGDAAAIVATLDARRCIQMDPLDRIGTNADLVLMARLDGVSRGAVFDALYPAGAPTMHAFEHFAKERCFLPARAFPAWREQAQRTPDWRSNTRHKQVPVAVLDAVLAEVAARGPVTAADLSDHGRVEPIDWSGWKGTSKATTMALEVLWLRCQVVTVGRRGRRRIFDVPRRALPAWHAAPGPADFFEWALLERVDAMGLLPRNTGPWWSMLRSVRQSLPDRLLAEGRLVEVQVGPDRARYLARPGGRDRVWPADDGQMRILGPLDPLLWSRRLVETVFGFEYVWEVYKPAAKRRYGYYVCPLLHHGRLVGRFEARAGPAGIEVLDCWPQDGERFDRSAFAAAIARHARGL